MTSVDRWITFTLLGAAALAIIAMPNGTDPVLNMHDPLDRAVREAHDRWVLQSELLRRVHGRELARAGITERATTPADPNFDLVTTPGVTANFTTRMRAMAAADFHDLPRRDSTVRVVVVLAVDTGPTIAGAPTHRGGWQISTDVFEPGMVADNVCAIVALAMSDEILTQDANSYGYLDRIDVAGPCYWYKAFGKPGRGVRALLDSTGSFAIATRDAGWYLHQAFGLGMMEPTFGKGRVARCAAGERPACEELVLTAPPDARELSARYSETGWRSEGRSYQNASSSPANALFDRMRRQFGTETFSMIWKSDLPFPAAFAAARGETLDAWVRTQILAVNYLRHSGPLPTLPGWIAFGVIIPGLIAFGVAGTARRSPP